MTTEPHDEPPVALRAPFPWFGGKSRAAPLIWDAFGDTPNYVEAFAGSLAVLLARPHAPRIETANDLDAYVANFFRALRAEPEAVAHWADWPVNETDLHARHAWLVGRTEFRARMLADPDYHDAQIAGWWVWGICQWIGGGWCTAPEWQGRTNAARCGRGIHAAGVAQRRPRLSDGGNGVHAVGLKQQVPQLGGSRGAAGAGVTASGKDRGTVLAWMHALAERLRRVRICCGDWQRVLGPAATTCIGTTAVLLDPPYSREAGRDPSTYAVDDLEVAHKVRAWALEHGDNPQLRIVLCGYEGEYEMPATWREMAWKSHGGYANQAKKPNRNRERERLWCSPHCLKPGGSRAWAQQSLLKP